MIVAANTGVCDEVELIERHVRHLQAIGVDRIVITDTGSTDGTLEVLQAFAARGDIALLTVNRDEPDAFHFANAMLRYTLREIRPDWVIFGDADEFVVPRSGRIQTALESADCDVLRVQRFNVPLSESGPLWSSDLGPAGHDQLLLITRPIRNFAKYLESHPDTAWILGQVLPKVITRAAVGGAGVGMGAHSMATPDGNATAAVTATAPDLLIAHVLTSSLPRFRRKLDNIRQAMASHGHLYSPQQAWQWRRWAALALEGRGDEEYRRQVFDESELARRRASRQVQSAAEWFAEVASPPDPA